MSIGMDKLIELGKNQREQVRGQMLPVLLIEPRGAADDERVVVGLATDKEDWPRAFKEIRKRFRPRSAALTTDATYRSFDTEEALNNYKTTPSEDPAATNALFILYVDSGGEKTAVLPYAVLDGGAIHWKTDDFGIGKGKAKIAGPMLDALLEMVE